MDHTANMEAMSARQQTFGVPLWKAVTIATGEAMVCRAVAGIVAEVDD